MDDLVLATQKLMQHGGYDWLLNGPSFWSVKQVADALTSEGMPASISTVTRWFRTLPHTQGSQGRTGFRASRNDLILLFASQMGQY
jgi:hypothetical protein